MRNILLTISYDGSGFYGWQRQDRADGGKPLRTVQGELEAALETVHKTAVPLAGSGRTDSGVHAAGQAANFHSPIDSIPVANYVSALNNLLPRDIRIHAAKEVADGFHARFDAVSRTYRYVICCGATPFAYEAPYVWAIRRYPSLAVLNSMSACLQGELDFTTFTAAGDLSRSKSRYIEHAVFYPDGNKLVFEIHANAFLWKMVRSLVGSMLHAEGEGRDAAFFQATLEAKDRFRAGPTAPPQGLFLWQVHFAGVRRNPARIV
jgi:tRNA pseudouridine38-40 synthase